MWLPWLPIWPMPARKSRTRRKPLQNVVTDPRTQQDLKETISHAKSTSVKADKILGLVTDAQLQADVLYNDKKGKWRTDVGAKLPFEGGFLCLPGRK